MYDFFKEIALESEEKLPEKRVENIKAAVLSRIKEENSMKKISAFKTFSIAATIAATAAMSAMMASAEKPAALPTGKSTAAIEQSTSVTEKTPKNEGDKVFNKENAANTEVKGDIPTDLIDGKWIFLELSSGNNAEFYVPDGKEPMTFNSVQAALDYANSHSTASTEEEFAYYFDVCDNFGVILVDS